MLPLKNKTVLITRPKEQATSFISKLQQLGATPVELPLICIEKTNPSELIETYHHHQFDWIVFTSSNAVHTFFEVIQPSLVNAKIAVIGPKTEEALNKLGIKSTFISPTHTAEKLANEIPIAENEHILLPQSAIAKNDIVEILEKRKAKVFPIKTYQNTAVKYDQEKLNKLINQKIDFITFTSGSTVTAYSNLNLPLKDAQVICIGPETAKVAYQHNIKVDAIANPHTVEGMVESMKELKRQE